MKASIVPGGVRLLLLFLGLFFFQADAQDSVVHFRMYSRHVGDSFDIRIRQPHDFDSSGTYSLLVAPDGNIGSGQYLISRALRPDRTLIITIGHTGNWHRQRERDFIPAQPAGEGKFRAQRFLLFLQQEFLPRIDRHVPHQDRRVLTGHSLGGLFCLYTALMAPRLFNRYEAISPSVWANGRALLKVEEAQRGVIEAQPLDIRIQAGALELFNRVLSSTRKFRGRMKRYPNVHLRYRTYAFDNHFSVRWPALKAVLSRLRPDPTP